MKLSDRIMNPSQKTNLTEVSSTASAQTSSWFGEPGMNTGNIVQEITSSNSLEAIRKDRSTYGQEK